MEVWAVGENGRWQLTDLQRFLVILTVILALFVAAMGLGSASVVLWLVAAFLLVLSGLAVFLVGLRHNGRKALQGTGYVISVARPPVDNIQGRCDMRMRVNLPGRPSADLKVRAPAVPVTRWPVVGQTLPIEAPQNNPRQVRVRWDLVELGYIRAPHGTPPRQSTGSPLDAIPMDASIPYSPTPPVHVYTEFADAAARSSDGSDGGTTLRLDPTPITIDPASFDPGFDPATFDPGFDDDFIPPPRKPRETRLVTPEQDLYIDFAAYEDPIDDDGPTERTSGPSTLDPDETDPDETGPDGPEPTPGAPPPPEPTPPTAAAPAPRDDRAITPSWEIDPLPERRPAPDDERGDAQRGERDDEQSDERGGGVGLDDPDPNLVLDPDLTVGFGTPHHDGPVRNIPLPRGAEEPSIRFFNTGRNDSDMPAMGGMLIVSDLDRSLRFYSELLGFTIVYASAGNAVVEYGGARILLQHMADFSSIDRRVGHLHIEVPDLDLAFADLAAKGVQFSHRPRMVSRGDEIELWKATFRDPDGHGIALTEWRERDA